MYKPKLGETYYTVQISSILGIEDFEWMGDSIDRAHFSMGNVFRTEQEAEDKLNELKQILKNGRNEI